MEKSLSSWNVADVTQVSHNCASARLINSRIESYTEEILLDPARPLQPVAIFSNVGHP